MQIVAYESRHAEPWKRLNEAWISRHFEIEPKDREVLDHPKANILDKGGHILMAEQAGEAVGCVALLALTDGGFEVAKMTVSETVRGTGLGRALLAACIETARAASAPRLYLETNSALGPALGLYRAMGFVELPPQATPYARCDVWMELKL